MPSPLDIAWAKVLSATRVVGDLLILRRSRAGLARGVDPHVGRPPRARCWARSSLILHLHDRAGSGFESCRSDPPHLRMTSMRVAVCQMRSGEDVEANLALAERLLRQAADDDADLATLPEMFTYLGRSTGRDAAAEPVPGPTTERLAAVARDREMWVLGGSVLETDGDRLHNTSVLFDRAASSSPRTGRSTCTTWCCPTSRRSANQTPSRRGRSRHARHRPGASGPVDLLRPALPGAVPGAHGARCRGALRAGAVPAHHGDRALGGAAAGAPIEEQAFVVAPAQWGPTGARGRTVARTATA